MKRVASSILAGLVVSCLWAEDYRYDVAAEDICHAEDIYPVTTADKTAFSGIDLSEWRVAGGFLKGANIASLEAIVCKEHDEDGARVVWLQAQDGSHVKGVKVRLWQDGSDVKVRALGAAYANHIDNTSNRGYCEAVDLDNDRVGTQPVAGASTAGYYGICRLTLVKKSAGIVVTTPLAADDTVTLGDYADVTIKAPQALAAGLPAFIVPRRTKLTIEDLPTQDVGAVFKGAGEVVFTHPTAEEQGTKDVVYDHWRILNWPVVATNFLLRDVVGVTADSMYRNSTVSTDVRAFYFSSDGATARVQLQAKIEGWLRCICVDLRQGAKGIEACIDAGTGRGLMYPPKQSDDFGYDFDTQPIGGAYGIQAFGSGGGLTNLRLTLKNRTVISLVGDLKGNDAKGMTLTAGSNATVVVTGNDVPPSQAVLAAQDGGAMLLSAPGVSWYGLSERVHYDVRPGGQVWFCNSNNSRAYADQKFRVSGGEAFFSPPGSTTIDSMNYVNELILENGAVVSGAKPRVGYTISPTWRVRGTGTSVVKSGFLLAPTASRTLTLDVNDVTGNADADLIIRGGIADFDSSACASLAKTGAGTVRLDASWSQKAVFSLSEGTWQLARNTTTTGKITISLEGGCLAAESTTTNAFAALALTKTSQMSIADGAEVSFASTAGTAWTSDAKLQIAADLEKCRIRFGTDDTGLTDDQIGRVRVNGKRVRLDAEGYLEPDPRGLLLLFR